jgi:hypothetical protein
MPLIIGSPPAAPLQLLEPKVLTRWSANKVGAVGFVAGLAAAVMLIVMTGLNPSIKAVVKQEGLLLVISVMLLTIVVHELLHAATYKLLVPKAPVWFGLDKQSGMIYCYCPTPLSRLRFIIVILTPFVLMTLVPFMLTSTGIIAPSLLLVVAGMNAIGAGADLVLATLAIMVPRDMAIQSSGMGEYYGQRPEA